ncbi:MULTISPECIES: ATP phosphoribosyltransferase [Jutongia]|jgi:ATP phosphoribosyltransferase|uniref:ATP phosphoribosyltransferase n=1 Tax=Jutongia huaianensis TaxID=2763668 RepID=A0ABR7N1P9_9FIRM|nr:ATP phosphoribosyltransferase [Jutongia huaianensis]MBS4815644.1 ATP phosphoribosyltransferase [Clostridium sp.]OKZ82577.1 MAG: ATP phosphoribosyltransferase [Clostridium sp. 44_14]RHU97354.1 ATP phosphoribosyltransferase [Clostridium sp. OM07-9AC]RHV04503.1 ATP phosphoribosyltransferase [Clostridium sp. OM07-10AC]CDE68102.1 aTP phosphoribosyltransferase [Clostridium sp. CAG:277]
MRRYITFALAKGRLAKHTLSLLEQIGITCEEMKDEKTRKLIFVNEELGYRFFLSKATDVPTYVEMGAADIGVVGKDTILEAGRKLYEVLDLNVGKCRMCVAGPESAREKLNDGSLIRVASKYPRIAKDYFYNTKHQTVEIIKLNGSVELAPIVGLSEVIVDIVETGSTLKENGLQVLEEICPLSARVVVNEVSMKMEHERITKLVKDLKKIVSANQE